MGSASFQPGTAGTKRVARGSGPRTPDFKSSPGSQGANRALPGVRGPRPEAEVSAVLRKISRSREQNSFRLRAALGAGGDVPGQGATLVAEDVEQVLVGAAPVEEG